MSEGRPRLPPGLYERLVTTGLAADLAALEAEAWRLDRAPPDPTLRAEVLARHLYTLAHRALEGLPGADDREKAAAQVALVNRLLGTLREAVPGRVLEATDAVDALGHLLRELQPPARGLAAPGWSPRPNLSLRTSGLLVNGHRDYQVGGELAREIASADRIDLLCAFVRWMGVRIVEEALRAFTARGGQLRVICSVYTGATERRAVDALVALGAQVKISYETAQTRLHAKAWLFHRASEFSTAYVGSSNLSRAALLDGLEWNVRLSQVDNAPILERFRETFEQYWQEPEFRAYAPKDDGDRLDQALRAQRSPAAGPGAGALSLVLSIDVDPKPHQAEMLDALSAERARGHHKNLVVAATGTGKTWVAGFDYRRLRREGLAGARIDSLLFVAHREEILRQSQQVFQVILRDSTFSELLVGSTRPRAGRHVFASIQSLGATADLDALDPAAFDMVIVDEFHHAAAPSYDRLLAHLRPKVLLGLTATPERSDGQSVLHWFDGRVACENRLWTALDQGLLCPFHYFGVHDGTDLSSLTFTRGRYAPAELENLYTGNDVRARHVLNAIARVVHEPQRMRALGFCVGVEHARFMARTFEREGLKAAALDGTTPDDERRAVLARLCRGDLQALFTVDLLNEGVDLPEVDTLLLLRPTESATIFLQQLGRGLRWSPASGKTVLTVLDFIGQAHRQYRFDVRYRALLSVAGTRAQVRRSIEADFPLLPAGCVIQLDRLAKEKVLANLKQATTGSRKELVAELARLGPATTLARFLRETELELDELYQRPAEGHSFTALRLAAGFEARLLAPAPSSPPEPAALAAGGAPYAEAQPRYGPAPARIDEWLRSPGRLLHVDDDERLTTWSRWLAAPAPPALAALTPREHRLALMLFAALGQRRRPVAELGQALAELWQRPALVEELRALLAILQERSRTLAQPLQPGTDPTNPLSSHATYALYEIIAAYHLVGKGGLLRETREGVLWAEHEETDLLFITLEKSEADFSPTTRYADHPISRTLFHWESQNATGPDSPTGRRYIEHARCGSKVVLFVRERKKDARGETAPYLCLGGARYVRHEGERPMKIVWELEREMPAGVFSAGKVAGG